jgi:cell division protein WhiA
MANVSFSEAVKIELSKIIPEEEHCVLAQAEARKYFTLVRKDYTIPFTILKRRCCKRAFIREAFVISGTISDPAKSYHFEICCHSQEKAEFLRSVMESFDGIYPKVVMRRDSWVVYLKESDQIVDMLGIMEAPKAFMEIENVRILKEMRRNVNRRVNFETANLGKTVSASIKQIEDITYIRDHGGMERLSGQLEEMAVIRLKYPEANLTELGSYVNPPIGKSGVNHRLRKISQYAQDLRNKNNDREE